ncbi:hypothetical protein [Pseudomonas sp. DSP3-2-2]|uniref:hypothetical protein n=1 Tax=unclassified Pseudomonas TaxID=196821 RepID=UPI003CF9B026
MNPVPFFPISWKALNNPQLLPALAGAVTDPFFSIAWQPTLGWMHYPYTALDPTLRTDENFVTAEDEKKRRSD